MERILVVDRLENGMAAMAAIDNFNIEVISNFEDGIEKIKKEDYSVVFSNLNLPLTITAKEPTKYAGGNVALECVKKKITPVVLFEYDGYSLIIFPAFSFAHEGFSIVPYCVEIKGRLRDIETWREICTYMYGVF